MSATDKLSSRNLSSAIDPVDPKVEAEIKATLAFARNDAARRATLAAARQDAANIAASLQEPSRQAETIHHHAALISAMNGSHDERGEQDALAVLEAFAMALGQIVCSMPDADRQGHLNFVMLRALAFADVAADQRVGASFYVEPDDMGQGGHA